MNPLDTILPRLREPERQHDGAYLAFCPAHADGKKSGRRSLSVGTGADGRALMHCYAGCEAGDIVAALGLGLGDLFVGDRPDRPDRPTPKKGRPMRPRGLAPAHVFTYVDADGQERHRKERYEWADADGGRHKDFRALRPCTDEEADAATSARANAPEERRKLLPYPTWVDGRRYLTGRGALDGVALQLYRLPAVVEAVAAGRRVVVVEGELKADDLQTMADRAQWPIVATCHPGSASGRWTEAQIGVLAGVDVVIFPDNDKPGRRYAAALAADLVTVGATVRVVEVPGLAEKEDIRDWLHRERAARRKAIDAAAEIQGWIDATEPLQAPPPSDLTDAPSAPDDDEGVLERGSDVYLARHLASDLTVDGTAAVFDHGRVHVWSPDQGVWQGQDEDAMRRRVGDYDGRWYRDRTGRTQQLDLSSGRVSGILRQLAAEIRAPGFFDGAPVGVAFADGFVRLTDDGDVMREPLSPRHAATWKLALPMPATDRPWTEQAPRWAEYLVQCLQNDPSSLDTAAMLAEFFGAAIFGLAPRYERALVLYGLRGKNGKSVFLDTLDSMFPREAVGAVSPSQFGRTFLLAGLVEKRVNIVHESPDMDLADSDTQKRVVSGQPVTVEHKNRDPFTARIQCAHVYSANILPRPRDYSGGQWRRWLLAVFDAHFRDEEIDRGLSRHFQQRELPGIAAWAIDGARRLIQRGEYTISARTRDAMKEWREDCNPVDRWLSEEVDTTTGEWTPARGLFKAYLEWARIGEHAKITETTFGLRLRAAGYEPERRRDHTGRQARSYPLVVRSALDLSDERSAVLAAQWARQ